MEEVVKKALEEVVKEALNDPNFHLGLAALVVGVITGLILPFLLAWRRKKLLWEVRWYPLLTPDNAGQFSFKRHLLRRMLFIIEIENAGGYFIGQSGVDIAKDQYVRKISVRWGEPAKVLSGTVVEERPPDLGAQVSIDASSPNRLILDPLLLNQGDRIRLMAVVENPEMRLREVGPFIRVEGRIVGIQRIQKKRGALVLMLSVGLIFLLNTLLNRVLLYPLIDELGTENLPWTLGLAILLPF